MRTLARMIIVVAGVTGIVAARVNAQTSQPPTSGTSDSLLVAPVAAPQQPLGAEPQKTPTPSRIYYGGSVTLSFGDVTRIGVYPMIGYKLTPKASIGGEVGYEYLKYDSPSTSTSNYGGSAFALYSILPQLYARSKFSLINYEVFSSTASSSRTTVPFLLLGGGVVQRMSARTAAYAEVLFDVLQDDDSPYESWEPFVSIGVGVGF